MCRDCTRHLVLCQAFGVILFKIFLPSSSSALYGRPGNLNQSCHTSLLARRTSIWWLWQFLGSFCLRVTTASRWLLLPQTATIKVHAFVCHSPFSQHQWLTGLWWWKLLWLNTGLSAHLTLFVVSWFWPWTYLVTDYVDSQCCFVTLFGTCCVQHLLILFRKKYLGYADVKLLNNWTAWSLWIPESYLPTCFSTTPFLVSTFTL